MTRRPRIAEVEVEQVADGRTVGRGVHADRLIVSRIGQVVAAAARDGRQTPVALDELQD